MSRLLSVRERLFCSRTTLVTTFLVLFALLLTVASASATELPDEEVIVVTATRLPQPSGDVPAQITVVQVDALLDSGLTNVGDALRTGSFLPVTSQGGPGAVLAANLEGASSAQVQVLIDGRPANNGLAPVDLSMIPLADVERIEIVAGPVSALYGANALGGVVNVITRRPPQGRMRSLEAGLGGFGERRLSVSQGESLANLSYTLSAGLDAVDGARANSDSRFDYLTGKVVWRTGEGETTLSARHTRRESGSPGSSAWLTPDARNGEEGASLDLTYQDLRASNLTLRLYHSEETITYDDAPSHSRHTGTWSGAEGRRVLDLGDHQMVVGGEFRADSAVSTNLSTNPAASSGGLYVEDVYHGNGPWSLTLGARYDLHSVYGSVVSPRVGVTRSLPWGNRLWFSAGRAFRAPSFEDLYWQEPFMSGNPNLRPETATDLQAGATLGAWDISLFHKVVKDNIGWQTDPVTWLSTVANLPETRFDGANVSYHRSLRRGAELQASYAWLRALDSTTGLVLQNRPAHRAQVSIEGPLAGAWLGKATATFASAKFADASNTKKSPGYAKLDLLVSRTYKPGVELQVKLDNALNAAYEEVVGYPMPGASLTTTLRYRF